MAEIIVNNQATELNVRVESKILPKRYICCSEFGNAHFKGLESPVDWDYHELMKGHDVMITAPKELVQLLETLENK